MRFLHVRWLPRLASTLLLALVGCSATPHTDRLLQNPPTNIPARHELADVPFHPQELYQCGPAALATVLQYSGAKITPEALVPRIYVPARQGSLQVEILAATRQQQRLAYTLEPSLQSLLAAVNGGQPVLVLQNLGLGWHPQWHYAVVVGYDLDSREVMLRSGLNERYAVGMRLFERTWKRGNYWGMVALRPGELPVDGNGQRYFLAAAAFERNGDSSATLRAWEAGAEAWPQRVEILMGYGNFLYGLGDLAGAKARFGHATEQQPDFAPAHNNLAQVLLELGETGEARHHALRAVEIGGEHAGYYQQTLEKIRLSTAGGAD